MPLHTSIKHKLSRRGLVMLGIFLHIYGTQNSKCASSKYGTKRECAFPIKQWQIRGFPGG
jgi:hypothetical protein